MIMEILIFVYCNHLPNDIKLRILIIKLRNVHKIALTQNMHSIDLTFRDFKQVIWKKRNTDFENIRKS